jgi:hypothetical protein
MKHVKYAEDIMSVTLEEKDPGLMTTGMTEAERELLANCEELIGDYFDDLTTEEKQNHHTLDSIHTKICESSDGKGWRKPNQVEMRKILYDVVDKSSDIESVGDDRFIWLG